MRKRSITGPTDVTTTRSPHQQEDSLGRYEREKKPVSKIRAKGAQDAGEGTPEGFRTRQSDRWVEGGRGDKGRKRLPVSRQFDRERSVRGQRERAP